MKIFLGTKRVHIISSDRFLAFDDIFVNLSQFWEKIHENHRKHDNSYIPNPYSGAMYYWFLIYMKISFIQDQAQLSSSIGSEVMWFYRQALTMKNLWYSFTLKTDAHLPYCVVIAWISSQSWDLIDRKSSVVWFQNLFSEMFSHFQELNYIVFLKVSRDGTPCIILNIENIGRVMPADIQIISISIQDKHRNAFLFSTFKVSRNMNKSEDNEFRTCYSSTVKLSSSTLALASAISARSPQ